MSALTRFWFEFQSSPRPSALNLGCGVTAYNYEDALGLLKEHVFQNAACPGIIRYTTDVDITALDAKHVLPNMGLVTTRGIWFPIL